MIETSIMPLKSGGWLGKVILVQRKQKTIYSRKENNYGQIRNYVDHRMVGVALKEVSFFLRRMNLLLESDRIKRTPEIFKLMANIKTQLEYVSERNRFEQAGMILTLEGRIRELATYWPHFNPAALTSIFDACQQVMDRKTA